MCALLSGLYIGGDHEVGVQPKKEKNVSLTDRQLVFMRRTDCLNIRLSVYGNSNGNRLSKYHCRVRIATIFDL